MATRFRLRTRTLIVAATASLLAVIGVAPPASAAPIADYYFMCDGTPSPGISTYNITMETGQSFTATGPFTTAPKPWCFGSGPADPTILSFSGANSTSGSGSLEGAWLMPWNTPLVVTAVNPGTATFSGSQNGQGATFNVTVTASAEWEAEHPQSSGQDAHRPITPERDTRQWFQQVVRSSADATCPDEFNPSWAQWPNGGAGGWVCDRSIDAYAFMR